MGRKSARKNAFYLIFQQEFTNNYEETKDIFFKVNDSFDSEDKDFILFVSDGVFNHRKEIDDIINSFSKGWSVTRLNKVDLAILRLAVFELKFGKNTPGKVAINEAVELAKKFSSEEDAGFINGVLGAFLKKAGD